MTTTTQIACGNRKVHGTTNQAQAHHHSTAEVRECFTQGGILSIEERAEATATPLADFEEDPRPEPKVVKPPQEPRPDLIPDGIYTIEDDTLSGGYRTIRIRTQDKDDDFAPGKRIVGYLSGSDNSNNYTGFAFLNGTLVALWKSHRDIPDLVKVAVLMEVGDPRQWLEAGHCYVCHRMLTTPESLARGSGPTCAGRA